MPVCSAMRIAMRTGLPGSSQSGEVASLVLRDINRGGAERRIRGFESMFRLPCGHLSLVHEDLDGKVDEIGKRSVVFRHFLRRNDDSLARRRASDSRVS